MMSSFMKINGAWKEGTPYLKEGGTWKEVGGVTARLNGVWSDIAPPKPMVEPREWTPSDFDLFRQVLDGNGHYTYYHRMNPDVRQYFAVGDKLSIFGDNAPFVSTPIPGATDGVNLIYGGVISGTIDKNDALSIKDPRPEVSRTKVYLTNDLGFIPITDGSPLVYEPRTWTHDDFIFAKLKYLIKPENRQFFMEGDSFDLVLSDLPKKGGLDWRGSKVAGLVWGTDGSHATLTGTIGDNPNIGRMPDFASSAGGIGPRIAFGFRKNAIEPDRDELYEVPLRHAP